MNIISQRVPLNGDNYKLKSHTILKIGVRTCNDVSTLEQRCVEFEKDVKEAKGSSNSYAKEDSPSMTS